MYSFFINLKENYENDWLQLDSNSQPLSWQTNTQPFSQTENGVQGITILIYFITGTLTWQVLWDKDKYLLNILYEKLKNKFSLKQM